MTVTPVNDAPVALNDTITWNEPNNETHISFSDLLHNDYDVDGDTLHLKRNYIEKGFENLSIVFNADSTITLRADSMEWCSAWFTYRIDDPSSLYDIGKVLIFPVLDQNNLITNEDHFNIDENSKNNLLDVLANDSIIDKQRCTIDTLLIVYPPKHATALPTNDFTISYTPEAHYYTRPNEQPDSLMYRAINIWGQSDSAWVYLNIVQKNTPPVANNDQVTPEFGKETAIDVLANDKDPDPDGFIIPSLTTFTQPGYGTLRYDTASGLFTYIPLIETCESDSFRYTIFDNEGGSDQALVTIQSPAEAPVTAVSDTIRTYPGIKAEVEPLLNDLGYFTPVIGSYENPFKGTILVGTDNVVTYQPEASFVGRDSMAYTITTPCGNSSSAYIVFLVEELRVPEIITPNGDTKNDVLIIDGIEYYPESILEIYNRYGHVVYSMRGYDNSWGGFSNKGSLGGDKPLPAATYYYVLRYNQGRNRQAGFIYLFR